MSAAMTCFKKVIENIERVNATNYVRRYAWKDE